MSYVPCRAVPATASSLAAELQRSAGQNTGLCWWRDRRDRRDRMDAFP